MTRRTVGFGSLLVAVATLVLASPPAPAMKVLVADDLYNIADETQSLAFLGDPAALGSEHEVTYAANTDPAGLPILTNNLNYLLNFGAVIFYKSGIDGLGRLLDPDEYDALLAYAEAGGNLVVTGPNLVLTPDGYDDLTADLIAAKFLGGSLDVDAWQTPDEDDFILNGPWGDVRGLTIALPEITGHEKMLADEALDALWEGTVSDPSGEYDKVIFSFFGDVDGVPINSGVLGWTGNWYGDDWYPDAVNGNPGLIMLQNFLVDDDGDSVIDGLDNCPVDANGTQADRDGDGFGDVCDGCGNNPDKTEPGECGCSEADTDDDDDRVVDCFDNCPFDYNPDQDDRDDDGIGDECDGSGGPLTIRCGSGASQAVLPILLGLGLARLGVTRFRRDRKA